MLIRHCTLASCSDAAGVVVVIDVLRSFTTAAYAFAAGASAIYPVGSVEAARRLRSRLPEAVTMGAVGGGAPVPEFDLGNSPAGVAGLQFYGRPVIHYTAAGVRGLVEHRDAEQLFAASFVCARATAAAIRRSGAQEVTLITTGEWIDRDGDEDRACADYLEALLGGADPDPTSYVGRVRSSDFGRRFNDPAHPTLPAADLDYAAVADRFDFAMPVTRLGDDLVIKPG